MAVVLINPFRVYDGKEQDFAELWALTAAIFQAQPGFIQAQLVKAMPSQPKGLSAPFTHVNIAYWQTASAYQTALQRDDIRKLGARYFAVSTFSPALYQLMEEVLPLMKG